MQTRYLTLAATLVAAPALAGGPGPVVIESAPVVQVYTPAPATDWTGFYAGLGYSKSMGSMDNGTSTDFNNGKGPGAFAGYNMQSGNFVYGGELAYTSLNDMTLEGDATTELTSAIDLKARLGYAAGRAMPYVSVGYSMANLDSGSTSNDFSGINYGLGLDYLVTDQVFLGVDYTKRNLSNAGTDIDASTVGLRVGYKF